MKFFGATLSFKKGSEKSERWQKTIKPGVKMKIFEYTLIDSTNEEARRYGTDGDISPSLPALFIAEEQTEGRGRMGRSFFSPSKTGLYASLLIEAPSDTARLLSLTSLAAVAASEAIYSRFKINVSIKWVNDLYLDSKKIAGILAESFIAHGKRLIVLGIGINLATSDFPEDLLNKAASLNLAAHTSADAKRALALDIFERLLSYLNASSTNEAMQIYRARSCVIGKSITFTSHGEQARATATGITDTGALCVRLESGEELVLDSGEISLILN